MSTSSLFGNAPPTQREPEGPIAERVHHLEDEVGELRDTIARFAELVLGEVKSLRKTQAELPVPPGISGALVDAAGTAASPNNSRRPWLLGELLGDFGATLRMYLDPRYRVRRATQLMVPLILILFAANYFVFHYFFVVPLLGNILEKIADIVLAILLYKVVTREVYRYRQALAQLISWQQYNTRPATFLVNGEPPSTRLETD